MSREKTMYLPACRPPLHSQKPKKNIRWYVNRPQTPILHTQPLYLWLFWELTGRVQPTFWALKIPKVIVCSVGKARA